MDRNSSIRDRYEGVRVQLESLGQGHTLAFWGQLDDEQRRELLADIERINLPALPGLIQLVRSGDLSSSHCAQPEPAPVLRTADRRDATAHGERMIEDGRIGALTVAGGQGTRLGFPGPKGAFPISPIRKKTLFQLFAESILAEQRRHGTLCHWYIMTSPTNHEATRAFFRENRYFGLPADGVTFFEQGVMPAFDRDGRILLDQPHRLALSPDGHGGSLLAMASTGVLADMARRGIDTISYFQVDNPLVHCLDPHFMGLHDRCGSEMSSKTLPKADDLERVGNFALCDGKLTVIEYSDLPPELAHARNPDGTRRFDAANIAIHALSRSFVERLTADRSSFALPWHRAEKKVPFVDLSTGRRVEPDQPNAIKLEAFIFDALPLARQAILVETSRAEEFSPVKNAEGVDSVATAQRDFIRRAARWLESAGATVRRGADGEPAEAYEISPLAATDAGQLALLGRERLAERLAGGRNYLE